MEFLGRTMPMKVKNDKRRKILQGSTQASNFKLPKKKKSKLYSSLS